MSKSQFFYGAIFLIISGFLGSAEAESEDGILSDGESSSNITSSFPLPEGQQNFPPEESEFLLDPPPIDLFEDVSFKVKMPESNWEKKTGALPSVALLPQGNLTDNIPLYKRENESEKARLALGTNALYLLTTAEDETFTLISLYND